MSHNIRESVDYIIESGEPEQTLKDLSIALGTASSISPQNPMQPICEVIANTPVTQPDDFMESYRELARRILSRPNGEKIGETLVKFIGTDTGKELLNPVFYNRSDNMNNLEIVKHTDFYGIDCDFYKTDTDDIVMTSAQLADCLGYASKDAIQSLISRNPYIKESEFSGTCKLQAPDGKSYNTRIFNEDGIYEITMLSSQPKAKEFRAFVRKTLKAIRKGEVKVLPTDKYKQALAEAKLLNARTRVSNQWLKIAEQVGSEKYKQICASYAGNTLAGCEVIPLPSSEQHFYSATEIGRMLGTSAQKIGSLANKNNLKTHEFGEWFRDKSPHSNKEVDTFRYNDRGVQRFREILGVDQQTA